MVVKIVETADMVSNCHSSKILDKIVWFHVICMPSVTGGEKIYNGGTPEWLKSGTCTCKWH